MNANFYGIDIIKTPDRELKIIDIHGHTAVCFGLFRNAYGRARERSMYHQYFSELLNIGNNNTIFYNLSQSNGGVVTTEHIRRIITGPNAAQPNAHERRGEFVNKKDIRTERELKAIQGYAQKNGVNAVFGYNFFRDLTNEEQIKLDGFQVDGPIIDNGVYVQRGEFDYPNLYIPMVNDPVVDFSLSTKLYTSLIMRRGRLNYYLPKHIFVGMGLCDESDVFPFLKDKKKVILKPTFGAYGASVEIKNKSKIEFNPEVFISPVPLGAHFPYTIADITQDIETYFPHEFGFKKREPYNPKWYFEVLRSPIGRVLLISYTEKGKIKLDDIVGSIAFPIHEFGSSILQEFVESELVKGKDGQYHKGYIRVLVFNGKFMGAWYRLPKASQNKDDFIDINRRDVPTFFSPVPDETLVQLSEFCLRFVGEYESTLRTLNIHSVDDLIEFKNNEIQLLLNRQSNPFF